MNKPSQLVAIWCAFIVGARLGGVFIFAVAVVVSDEAIRSSNRATNVHMFVKIQHFLSNASNDVNMNNTSISIWFFARAELLIRSGLRQTDTLSDDVHITGTLHSFTDEFSRRTFFGCEKFRRQSQNV